MPIDFCHSAAPVLSPHPECPWASKMVLNPAILADPDDPRTIHMLFRATGPWPQGRRPGRPDPFPIFLGYAVSRDEGRSWQADFSKPALAPALADAPDALWVEDEQGGRMPNYANGCIEDPRLFSFEGSIHLSVACRLFRPGPIGCTTIRCSARRSGRQGMGTVWGWPQEPISPSPSFLGWISTP